MSPRPAPVLDLDKERAVRAEAGAVDTPIVLGGVTVATLPAELPLAALAPLRSLDQNLALLLSTALDVSKGNTQEAGQVVIDMLVSKPTIPGEVVDVLAAMARGLITDEGYDALMAARPSIGDLVAIARYAWDMYSAVSPGEASRSSESSESDGTTSKPTSSGGTDSTLEGSGDAPETLAS